MIISCTSCNKKFEINSDLIPDSGRLLACSNCNNQWFFTKKNISDKTQSTLNELKISPNNDNNEEASLKKIIKNSSDNENDNKKKFSIEISQINKKKTDIKNNFNILNKILIFIISSVALIILVDTFKYPISIVIPNIEIILYNLYETLTDIILFFKDLIK